MEKNEKKLWKHEQTLLSKYYICSTNLFERIYQPILFVNFTNILSAHQFYATAKLCVIIILCIILIAPVSCIGYYKQTNIG